MALLLAIIALGILIVVHEFGHFIAAKLLDIYVERFSVGFGPKLLSFRGKETEYVLSLVPLGGYVKLLGEDSEDVVAPELESRAFNLRPIRDRVIVVIAGPLANILFATFLLFAVNLMGLPSLVPEVGKVLPNTPAYEAGFKPGDTILEIEGRKISQWSELVDIVHKNPDKVLGFKIKRGEKIIKLRVKVRSKVITDIFGRKKRVGFLGIIASGRTVVVKKGVAHAFFGAFKQTWNMIYLTVLGIVKIIERVIPLKTIGGPIMIVQMAKQQAQFGMLNFLLFLALISVNLGIINLLPIPVLDGGHLVFFTIEGITGKPISLRTREIAQQVGLFIIVLIMILAFYNDILRIMGK